ncbi:MAG TPA: universal stress protein [Solirubrobacteraceae bacterium]|nr:universal stress protein [Solirubrobacteraceae bacterium]
MADARTRAEGAEEAPASEKEFGDALCAVDGTEESLAAVEHAAALAGPGGHVTLLVVTSYRTEGERRSPAIGPISAKAMLDRAVAIAKRAGVSVSVEVDPASPPARVVLDWAYGRSLLALGAPATSWFGGMFFGGVAVEAEGALGTPLLVARARPGAGRFSDPIVVASDGLEGSDELVELGGRLARAQDASAVLVHALGAESQAHPHRVSQQAHRLQSVTGGRCELVVEPGSARNVIVDAARAANASLVVMSSRRLHGLGVIGSVSRRVVHQGHCSVLLVPPERLLAL